MSNDMLPKQAIEDLIIAIKNYSIIPQISKFIEDHLFITNPNTIIDIMTIDKDEKKIYKKIINILIQFIRIFNNSNCTIEEFLIEIKNQLMNYLEKDKRRDNILIIWNNCKNKIIEKVVEYDSPFHILEKSIKAAYANCNLFQTINLDVNTKPIFNEDNNAILKTVMVHSMTIFYYEGEIKKQLTLTIDMNDLESIKNLCDEAKEKSYLTYKEFKKSNFNPSLIGDDSDR